jgi:transglutaminase-like putative cysteine protease
VHQEPLFQPDKDQAKKFREEYKTWFLNNTGKQDNYYRYDVVMEASDKPWLFSLDWARPLTGGINRNNGFALSAQKPITEPFVYQLESLAFTNVTQPPHWMNKEFRRELNLQLPKSGNKRSRQWALELRKKADSDKDFISQVLSHFREQPFYYTLKPPLLGKDSIDQFLFSTQRGFCSHYASTFTFLARSAGIPARVVVGYQGGEQSSLDNYLLVYQFDAHAWSEVWLPEQGWVRVDPTAAVSPARIENGIEDALGSSSGFLAQRPLSLLRYRDVPALSRLRHSMDYLRMLWIQKVVGYDGDFQTDLFHKLFGSSDLRTVVFVLVGSLGGVMLLIFLVELYANRPPRMPPEQRMYLKFCRKISKRGCKKGASEGESAFAQRVSSASPELAEQVLLITDLYVQLMYRPLGLASNDYNQRIKELRKQVRGLSVSRTNAQGYLHRTNSVN